MAYLLCCRTRPVETATEMKEQVDNLLQHETEIAHEYEEDSQDEMEDEAGDINDPKRERQSLKMKMDESEKGLMERISTVEAIVAMELERIHGKTVETNAEQKEWEEQNEHCLQSEGGARGETELDSGAVVDDPASSAAAVSEGDQISIAPREEITEMEVASEEPPSSAAASVADLASNSPTTTSSTPDSTSSSTLPTSCSTSKEQSAGTTRQDVTGGKLEKDLNEEQVEKDEEINLDISRDKSKDGNIESLHSRREMGDAMVQNSMDVQDVVHSDLKREFSTSLYSLESAESTTTLTSEEMVEPLSDDLQQSPLKQRTAESAVNEKRWSLDLDIQCPELIEDVFDESAKELAHYLKIRTESAIALSSEESLESDNEIEVDGSVDLADLEEGSEAPPISEDEMAEATAIPKQSFVDFVNEILNDVEEQEIEEATSVVQQEARVQDSNGESTACLV